MRYENCPPSGVVRFAARLRAAGGFSLIELLTTMSILAVMLAIASPGLASLVSANALSGAQNDFAAAIVLARSEAMKRGLQVGIAAAAPASGTEFSQGWNVFVDSNGNGQYDVGEAIIRQEPALRGDVRVASTSGATLVLFNGRGFLAPSSMLTFNVCSNSAPKSYIVRVEPVGLADVSEGTGCP